MMRSAQSLGALVLAALLAGCAAPSIAPGGGGAAAAGAPPADEAGAVDPAERALGAYGEAVATAGDGAALRLAFDLVELALAVTSPEHRRRGELLAAEGDLVARLAALDAGLTPEAATASPEPPVTAPAATLTPLPAPAATGVAAATGRPGAPAAAPPRRPAPATFAVTTRKSFEGSGNSGQFASCIDVQILGRSGPVGGAVIGINNGDHSYQDQTDPNGYSGRCGLGASTWSVVVFWTPGGGQARGAATTVYISGAPEQRAAVVFQER